MIAPRLALVAGATAMWMTTVVPAVTATDLAEYLRDADEAVYAGRKIVITVWDGDAAYALLDIEHAMGVTLVERYGGDVVVGAGKMKTGSGDGAIQFVDWTEEALSSRYTAGEGEPAVHGGRPAVAVDVFEGDTRRARLVFDDESHAPLVTEVYDGDGRLFRYSSMVQFTVGAAGMPRPGGDDTPYHVAVPLADHDFPGEAGPYRLVDAYGSAAETVHGFYSDGLFSFSLFVVDGRADIDAMVDGSPFRAEGFDYTIVVAPTESWLLWHAGSSTYVLVGDMPPDHLEQIVADLPRPNRWNWLQRVWHSIFD